MKIAIGFALALLVIVYPYFVPHYREYRVCSVDKKIHLDNDIKLRAAVFLDQTSNLKTLEIGGPLGRRDVTIDNGRLVTDSFWKSGTYAFSSDVCLRFEYRQRAADFISRAFQASNFEIVSVAFIVLLQSLLLIFWYFRPNRYVLLTAMLLSFLRIWMVSPALSGGDDTYHLSGIYREANQANISQTKSAMRDFTLNSTYYQLHQTNPAEVARLAANPHLCPHNLVQTPEAYCYGPNNHFVSLVGVTARIFGISEVKSLIRLVRAFNFGLIFLSMAAFALVLVELFKFRFLDSFLYCLGGFLINYTVVSNAITITNDYFFLFGGAMVMLACVLSQRITSAKQFAALGAVGVSTYFMLDDRSAWPLGFLFLLMAGTALYTSYERLRNWQFFGAVVTAAFLFAGYILYQISDASIVSFKEAFLNADKREPMLSWFYMAVTGSLLSGKWGYPPIEKALLTYFIFWFTYAGFKHAKKLESKSRVYPYVMLLLTIALPLSILILGAVKIDLNWISIRFAYPFLGGYLILLALAASKMPRPVFTIALLIQIIAPATIEFYVYWQRLNYFP